MTSPTTERGNAWEQLELLATVFVTGAAVMTIEIVGTRVIGPVFGVNLFVWSALLTVTLGSLAVGYWAGGVAADRVPTRQLLSVLVIIAGGLLALSPVESRFVLQSCQHLGPRGGALLASALLFSPPLIALGMTAPVAVRLATSDVRRTGHSAGTVYAVSTVGSLLGTLAVGFVLVPAVETQTILLIAASALIVTGSVSLALRRKFAGFSALLLPLLAVESADAVPLPKGLEILARSQSLYGLVEVVNDENRGVRLLRADHSVIGAQFVRDKSSGFAFLHQLEAVRFLRPAAKDVLQIGLGIGSLPSVLGREGMSVEVVEIDPAVVRFARDYFGFVASGPVHVEDARAFLRRTERRYDLVVHDTFTGGTTPEHLLSREVLNRIHEILRPGGILALTCPGYEHGEKAEALWAVARTVRSVFRRTRIFRDHAGQEDSAEPSNYTFFASDDAIDFVIPKQARFENELCEEVQRSLADCEVSQPIPPGPAITDARNPLGRLQLPIAEAHFDAMNKLLPPEVWLQ